MKPATSYTRIDGDGKPYLEGSRCNDCGAVFLGLREHCGRCGMRARMLSIHLGERGRLYNYTIVYRSYPGIKVPFISAIVGPRRRRHGKGQFARRRPGSTATVFRHASPYGVSRSRSGKHGGRRLYRSLLHSRSGELAWLTSTWWVST